MGALYYLNPSDGVMMTNCTHRWPQARWERSIQRMKKSYEIDMCNGPLLGKILVFSIPPYAFRYPSAAF